MTFFTIALWFVSLPYLSRLPYGLDWTLAYLPDDGKLLFGLAFFSAFNVLPAFVVRVGLTGSRTHSRASAAVPFLVMSAATAWAHHDYDLASDAQAAIWLVVAPVFVSILGAISLALLFAGSWVLRRLRMPGD